MRIKLSDSERAARTRAKKSDWRKANPEKVRASNGKFYKENLEKMRARRAKYWKEHPEQARATDKKFRESHRDKVRAKNKKWNTNHPESIKAYRKKDVERHQENIKMRARKYYKLYPERVKANAARYQKTDAGKESMKKNSAKRRTFGFVPLNEIFEGSHGHHIDDTRAIYMPADMHRGNGHSVLKQRNMKKVNDLAFLWLEAEELYAQVPQ